MSVAAQEDYAFTNKLIFQVIRNLIAYFGKSFILIFFSLYLPLDKLSGTTAQLAIYFAV